MESRQLVVSAFLLTCVMLSDARFLRRRVPDQMQRPAEVEVKLAAGPEREHSRKSVQPANRLQTKLKQPAAELLSWKFPKDPVDPVKKVPVKFELRQQVTTDRVALRCGESKIQVEVSQDLFSSGRLIQPEEITLGGCSATEVDSLSHVVIFESELHTCGSILVMTEDVFIYAFTLVYSPRVSPKSPIIRRQHTDISVECHYSR